MPHFFCHPQKTPIYPAEIVLNDTSCRFLFEVKDKKGQKLIYTVVDESHFFLQARFKESQLLVKPEKVTRVSNLNKIFLGLKAYARLIEASVISHNFNTKINHHLEQQNQYLMNVNYFCSGDFKEKLQNYKGIMIDVGFGSGRHLLKIAQEYRDFLIIGLEIHKPSIEQVSKQINLQDLQNVLLCDFDARVFLQTMPFNKVERIFVHFPIPWDKTPHKRVICKNFLKQCHYILVRSGFLHIRTDSINYFNWCMSLIGHRVGIFARVFKNQTAIISSKYEDRWRKMGKNIFDIEVFFKQKCTDLRPMVDTFVLPQNMKASFEHLYRKVLLVEGGLAKVENIFSNAHRTVLQLVVGEFEAPQKLFVLFDDQGAQFFPRVPVQTLVAHQALNELKRELNAL